MTRSRLYALPRILWREAADLLMHLFFQLPGRTGIFLRAPLFKLCVARCGRSPNIGVGADITGGENIRIGEAVIARRFVSLHAAGGSITIRNDVAINSNSSLVGTDGGRITIGNTVIMAQNVVKRAGDHRHQSLEIPIRYQGHEGGEISIEDDVWTGANVAVTQNVRIGAHSIVAAGAVVTRDVEPYSIMGGVPAKLIRRRTALKAAD